nr:MAG TPA: hypothetical protein [Caudoviricetes sp.]
MLPVFLFRPSLLQNLTHFCQPYTCKILRCKVRMAYLRRL